jgi:hypothetical protein
VIRAGSPRRTFASGVVIHGGDVTPPTLSAPTAGTPTSDGSTGAGVTTNEGNGTLYWAVVTNGGSCTDAQLKAGSGGNIVAGKAGNQAVSTTGAQTIATITGLSASTTYQIKFLQRDAAGNDSSQASVSLTTSAAAGTVVLKIFNENGANGTTSFTDQSASAHTMTAVGNVAWSNASAPTGMTTAVVFDGNGDSVTTPNSADFQFGSGDWAIEVPIYAATNAGGRSVYSFGAESATSRSLHIYLTNGGINLQQCTNGTTITTATRSFTTTVNTWYWLQVTRSGSVVKIGIDGVQVGADITAQTLFNSTSVLRIGDDLGGSDYSGKMGPMRVTKGASVTIGAQPSLPYP